MKDEDGCVAASVYCCRNPWSIEDRLILALISKATAMTAQEINSASVGTNACVQPIPWARSPVHLNITSVSAFWVVSYR
eukprot:4562621-Amphidinium_carterae.1